jgi:hypothetical protein
MLLHDGEQLQSHPARPLGPSFPLLHRRLARVEIAGEHKLADIVGFAEALDVAPAKVGVAERHCSFEIAHRRLVDHAGEVQSLCRRVARLECVALELLPAHLA